MRHSDTRRIATTTATTFLIAALCSAHAADGQWVPFCPDVGSGLTIPMEQWAPELPAADGARLWQLNLCGGDGECESGDGFVCSDESTYICAMSNVRSTADGNTNNGTCLNAFTERSDIEWAPKYGGLHRTFSGFYAWDGANSGQSAQGSRVANVTLVCDPAASEAAGEGPVLAWSSETASMIVWTYNIRIRTSKVCGHIPPPSGAEITIKHFPASDNGCPSNSPDATTELLEIGQCYPHPTSQARAHICIEGPNKKMTTYYFNSTQSCGHDVQYQDLNVSQCYSENGGYFMVTQCPYF